MIKNELSLAYKAPEIKTITVEGRRCMAVSGVHEGYEIDSDVSYGTSDIDY